jgi:hypothetical protein
MLSLEEMEYERPYPMTEVDERTEIYCSRCGVNSKPKRALARIAPRSITTSSRRPDVG